MTRELPGQLALFEGPFEWPSAKDGVPDPVVTYTSWQVEEVGMGYQYCDGCNTYWVDTGCGQPQEHARCPVSCGICGLLMTGREEPGACEGHTLDEHRAKMNEIRNRR